jgi:hypothetical protein
MTIDDEAAIASGTPYLVSRDDGLPPVSAAEFLDADAFVIDLHGHQTRIGGVGVPDETGTGVRFYQKDFEHAGRDVRVWHIRALPDRQVIAQHEAAI